METKQIFDGAKFGDRFMTRDGRMAILLCIDNKQAIVVAEPYGEGQECVYHVSLEGCYDGIPMNDNNGNTIVSRWEEPIDEEKLDELANEYFDYSGWGADNSYSSYIEGFKQGYRAAKQE